MKNFSKQKNKAFTLVETLVAVSIFTMSILGLISVLASGISDTNYAKQKITAAFLAQEGIECVRNKRDNLVLYDTVSAQNGWNTFKASSKNCPIVDSDFSGFTRTITADTTSFGSNEIKIFSRVDWTQASGNYNIILSENLYNWME